MLIQRINLTLVNTDAIEDWVKLLAKWAGLDTHLVIVNETLTGLHVPMSAFETLRIRLSWLFVAVLVQVVFVQIINDPVVDTLTLLLWV